ncbi:MAG: hypothetical protein JWO08_3788 [Verrucomicrobiaceae bacterium]|nr:hypothetical protein [Verrucomicrobiaceae bacterium]
MLLMNCGRALAHAIPSLTVEAIFNADRSYVLRVNVDPRLFLSTKPTELPPVEAAWYRDQTPEQLKATEKKSNEYLASALSLIFSDHATAFPPITYQPMDGATNLPLAADSKEVHLLAEMHGQVPPGALNSAIAVSKEANTSVILINSQEGKQERRPQVLFPGETSRPFELSANGSSDTAPPKILPSVVTTVEVREVSRTGPMLAVVGAAAAVMVLLLVRKVMKK